MATTVRAYDTPIRNAPGVLTIRWQGLDGDDVGRPVRLPHCADKCVQLGAAGGNTDGGSTTVFQGSNDPEADPDNANHGVAGAGATWFTLNDTGGTALSRTTSAKLKQVLENPLWVRPSQSGGSAGDIDVILVCKGDIT